MFDLDKLRLAFKDAFSLNGFVSDFVNLFEDGSMINDNILRFGYGVNLSLVMEEGNQMLNGTIIKVIRGTDASIRRD